MDRPRKPLNRKAYGSIGHFADSRQGPGDHHVSPGQQVIATEKARDRHDHVIVQEKLDGSCTAVALIDGQILALGRAGHLAQTSPYEQHQLFAAWVREREDRFRAVLFPGERLVGEWLAQAHGTRYDLPHEPWVAFDLMRGEVREPFNEFAHRVSGLFTIPRVLHDGGPYSIAEALEAIKVSGHGAIDPVEGAVWRVERRSKTDLVGRVDFLAKYVRPGKVDGTYLPEISGERAVWNWRP